MKKTRTRFAPSPTGFLHIGSLRTILFSYLIAKKDKGDFILRIEDTDQKRKVEGAVEKLFEITDWLGIEFDESPRKEGKHGPYTQSERREVYDKHKKQLLDQGRAYPCFCTAERLTKMREEQQKNKLSPRYDRACRNLSAEEVEKRIKAGETYVIRQKMPLEGETVVVDELRGEIRFKNEELDDQVLIKSDGMPTYQFAVVVDDHEMEISHVVRGEEWIPSFPKNFLLYKAFDWEAPKFVHIPLTMNKEGGKLSKRQGDVAVEDYRNKGYLQIGLINFCVLLGWSPYAKASRDKRPEGTKETLTLEEVEKAFDIKDIGISSAIFDIDKLDYFNAYHIRQLEREEFVELALPFLEKYLKQEGIETKELDSEYIKKVILLEQERIKKLSDIGEKIRFFFEKELVYDKSLLIWKKLTASEIAANLEEVYKLLEGVKDWKLKNIEETLVAHLKENNLKVGDYLWPMRVSLSGQKASPSPFEIADVYGKEKTLNKITKAINLVKEG